MGSATYAVKTIDVDGSRPARKYKTLDAARKRFEEMYGHSMESAIEDAFYALADAGKELPTVASLLRLRAVSDFGTVVIFNRIEDSAP